MRSPFGTHWLRSPVSRGGDEALVVLGDDLLEGLGVFDSVTGWGVSAQSSITGGVVRVVSTDGSYQYITRNGIPVTQGTVYRFDLDLLINAAGQLRVQGTGVGLSSALVGTSLGAKAVYVIAQGTGNANLYLDRYGGVTDVTFDNITMREVLEAAYGSDVVVNGTFDTNTDWSGTGGSWTISGGALNAVSASGNVYQTYAGMVPGGVYHCAYDVTRTGGAMKMGLGGGAYGTIRSATGSYSDVLIAGSANQNILIDNHGGFTGTVDNVVLRRISA